MAQRRSYGWGDALGEAVYWYRIANDSARGIDAGLPCAHTALERLSYEVWAHEQYELWARDQEAINEKKYRDMGTAKRVRLSYEVWARDQEAVNEKKFRKMGTAERARTLLCALDVPCEIPPSAESLRKAVEGSPSPRKDAAQALADIRNDLVHGGRGRADIPQRFIEAWTLAMWFVEMAILSLCGYCGWHWNRISREPERVPWASPVAEREGKGEEAT